MKQCPRILVIGGGAGGLELATRLGNKLGKKKKAQIILVDRNRTHLWKPLLHEVATGSLDSGIDAVGYRVHGHNHHFEFRLGSLMDIDRDNKQVILAPLLDENGAEVLPERRISYDYLVLAIGSVTNDFGTQGVADHCIFLDSPKQAERFHQKMLNAFLRADERAATDDNVKLNIAIVGAGATGVELSAELFNAAQWARTYGLKHFRPEMLKVTLVEAGPRILPALPERISGNAHQELVKLGVDVKVATRVTEATGEGLVTDGGLINAELMVWAAGVKAPDFLKEFGGLESARNNALMVKPTLQTTLDEHIYALGDCAACPLPDGRFVPPRAQSAHQMATQVYKNLLAQLSQKPLSEYQYVDHGSLVNLSRYSTVGSLMGNLTRGSMMIEGRIARVMYISLYRMHQYALHGWFKTWLIMLVSRIHYVLRPRLKLH